ncbi:penicillin-binding protein 2, partial [Streptomyces sp. SID7982]|nr:penicillin-binding protein 2 [Streptomyces sp. SID7982]
TISQGGTGSGSAGPAVRKIYDALYGLDSAGNQDKKRALLPEPQKALPKVQPDGSIPAPKVKPYDPTPVTPEEQPGGQEPQLPLPPGGQPGLTGSPASTGRQP